MHGLNMYILDIYSQVVQFKATKRFLKGRVVWASQFGSSLLKNLPSDVQAQQLQMTVTSCSLNVVRQVCQFKATKLF